MKKCHACGQKLPLKTGDVVQAAHPISGRLFTGVVTALTGLDIPRASVVEVHLNGRTWGMAVSTLTRLHGYFRITERESLR